ncbi:hypothetical protein BH23VER1_BH23VER1_24570 [soil metagenome]
MFDKVFGKIFKPAKTRVPGRQGAGSPAARAAADDANVPAAKRQWEERAAREINPKLPGEELCELRDGMTHAELREHLSLLYRRHNRAASSLDPKLRREANIMLDAIVAMRQKYLGDSSGNS